MDKSLFSEIEKFEVILLFSLFGRENESWGGREKPAEHLFFIYILFSFENLVVLA